MELMDLVISNDLTQTINFPTQIPDFDCHSPALLDFFSSDVSICSTMVFPLSGISDHVIVSVSIDFLSNSQRDAPFHCTAYYCSSADWNGLGDHLRDVPWDNIFKLTATSEFCKFVSGFRLELMYISLIVLCIRSSLTHLHGFWLLMLLS